MESSGTGATPENPPREREVVRLVADRRTAAEIAGELGLSVRTVQNHTAAAYRKLGISSRRDLPADL